MARKRGGAEEIRRKLRAAEAEKAAGLTIREICKKLRISRQTFYRWRKRYGGAKATEAKKTRRLSRLEAENARLKEQAGSLEAENVRLRNLVVAQALDIHALRKQLTGTARNSDPNPSERGRGAGQGERMECEVLADWGTAYRVCEERGHSIIVKVGTETARIWPNGEYELLCSELPEPEETVEYESMADRTEPQRRRHELPEPRHPAIPARHGKRASKTKASARRSKRK